MVTRSLVRPAWAAALCALALALVAAPPPAAADEACHTPGHSAYASHECKVERLRERPFTVIAVVDDGINPYHVDFRLDPDDDLVGVHPSEYIDGYPADAFRMQLSFDAGSLGEARASDAGQWERAETEELSWVDGTTIIGGHSAVGDTFATGGSHGTPVASQAAGRVFGPDFPNVLIVAVRSFAPGLRWAAQQPWIDVITGSWSSTAQTADETYAAVAEGKTVCFATGNLSAPIWFFSQQGPSWHVNVGAVHAEDRHEPYYTGWPADVLGITGVPAAEHTTMDGSRNFAGTSGATPAVCGLIAHTISEARARMGDATQGPRDGVVAEGLPGGGPSADGRLTRAEVEDAVFATAVPSTMTPEAQYVRGGYGIVDRDTVEHALGVLFGELERPERPDEDRWIETTNAARDAVWGDPPP